MTAQGGLRIVTAAEAAVVVAARRGRPRQLLDAAVHAVREAVLIVVLAVLAVLEAVVPRVSTTAMRKRAWAAGFGFALGAPAAPASLSLSPAFAQAANGLRRRGRPAGDSCGTVTGRSAAGRFMQASDL